MPSLRARRDVQLDEVIWRPVIADQAPADLPIVVCGIDGESTFGMIRRDASGLLRLRIATGGTVVDGWMLPFGNQLAAICVDVTSGAILFGLFNGVGTATAEVVDGLVLSPALDAGRTPTAYAMMFERVGDLTGDTEADDRRLAELGALDPVAPDVSIPDALRRHLTRDFGPAQAALGGDLLLRLPLSQSLARGPAYRERS